MIETAIVIDVYDNNTAKVTIIPQAGCETCPAHEMCSNWVSRESMHYIVNNSIGAKKNDNVKVEFSEKHLISHSFIVYIVPLIFLFLGAYIGKLIFHNETASIVSGFTFLGLTFLIIAISDRRVKDPLSGDAKIIEILKDKDKIKGSSTC